ncbi:MAG: hypothetical protein E7343_01565 [Clostridiales bacterium]|nr:hypothetical protein [Clostridiales bacterium]
MKKFLLAVLSVLGVSCLALGASCIQNEDPNSSTEQTPQTDVVVLNGFNRYEDVAVIYLDPATFDGSFKLNDNSDYFVEGGASYKIYIANTKVNQPNLKLSAGGLKSDITDVTEFGLYVYNENDYSFDIIVTAYAGDTVVCAPVATVAPGANNLTFPINRALVQKSGKVVTDYSISFSGLKSKTTLYFDNFHVKTTTAPVVLPAAVSEIITAIDRFTEDTSKETLEGVMMQYNALSAEDKKCVTNYERLSSLLTSHWLQDIAQAQVNDPETLLYFDRMFGTLQVSKGGPGISSYSYSTAMKYGEEAGSMKVDFEITSTNWVSLYTTATTSIEEENIEFYVYNDSDQYKAMCLGWNVPFNSNYAGYMELAPHEWTKVLMKSEKFTNVGAPSGVIQICGLSDLTNRSGQAPDGSLYFSSFKKQDNSKQVIEARTGDEANTLFFFDRDLGLNQVVETGGFKELSTDTVFNGESGALKMTYTGQKQPTLALELAKYPFNEDDYVVMNVYPDVNTDYVQVTVGTLYGTRALNNKWTTMIIPAKAFNSATYFLVQFINDGGSSTGDNWIEGEGSVYFTKAKVYSGDQLRNLTGTYDYLTQYTNLSATIQANADISKVEAVADDFEYNVGSTKFVGKVDYYDRGTFSYNPIVYGSWYDADVALVGNAIRFYARANISAAITSQKTAIGMELKDSVDCSGKTLYIVASGLIDKEDVDDLAIQLMSARDATGEGNDKIYATSVEVLADGYVRYGFDVSGVDFDVKYLRLWTGHDLNCINVDYEAVTIRDISFGA